MPSVGRWLIALSLLLLSLPGGAHASAAASWTSLPGREVNVGEVYLPLVPAGTLRPVSETEDTVIPFPDSILAEFPHFEGVEITVPADSLYADDGTRGGEVGIVRLPEILAHLTA